MKKNFRKKIAIYSILIFSLILMFSIIQAEDLVCCEETNSGDFCQYVEKGECSSSNAAPTSCDETSYCQKGTCIDDDEGICTAKVRKATCENSPSGYWQAEDIDELYSCQEGCCFAGDNAEFITQIECTQIATDFGINTDFDSSITDEFTCIGHSNPSAKGACVLNEGGKRSCTIERKEDCTTSGGSFNEGILCSADYLESGCGKSENTKCEEDGRVYFLDSCGNYANVYDSKMYTNVDSEWTQEMEDYWNKIQEPICQGQDSSGININCGDCSRIPPVGSVCKEASRSENPEFGEYTCQTLDCEYKNILTQRTETYKNGEKWCADSPGIYQGIKVDDPTNSRIINQEIKIDLIEGIEEYNLPGSQYTLLTCWDGEILSEPCAMYRNEYCAESTINTFVETDFKTAWCAENQWRKCTLIENKDECVSNETDCKWLEGYTFRFDENGRPTNLRTSEDMNRNVQGSCVPLIAPGIDFWNPESPAQDVCSLGLATELILYEEWWGKSNAEAEERFLEDSEGEYWAEQRCYDNCYSIPNYGEGWTDAEIQEVHEGARSVTSKDKDSISQRNGYYCTNSDDLPSKGKVSGIAGCAGEPDDQGWFDIRSRRQYPIFFTNNDWLNFITTRTRSLGDCGYKPSSTLEESDINLEVITTIFQKLEGKDEEAKNVSEELIIFRGNDYLEEAEEVF